LSKSSGTKYEINILVELHPEADFAGTDDELENVYTLIESAICDVDDVVLKNLEVMEHG